MSNLTLPLVQSAPANDSSLSPVSAIIAKFGDLPAGMTEEQIADRQNRINAEAAEREQRRQESNRLESLAAFRKTVGVDCDRFRFETYKAASNEQIAALHAARNYAGSLDTRILQGEGLVLFGPVGTGKDHLACAIANSALRRRDCSASWVSCMDWFGRLRDNIADEKSEAVEISALCRPTILILSDPLGPVEASVLSPYQASLLYRVIDRRRRQKKLTIVTLNVHGDAEADRRLGAPVWDRLCENAWKVKCAWETFRRPAWRVNC
jgi:DNA replication protein DnaC